MDEMQTSTAAMTSEPTNDAYYAKLAMTLMEQYRIPPSPENYAVWYHYALSQNKALVREIDNIINNGLGFTQDTSAYLYNKFIAGNRHQRVVNDTAVNAQKVLMEVLKVINDFSGETQSYNKGVDEYIETISQNFEGTGVKDIVKELISATSNLKQSGEKIQLRLEESKQEINHLKQNLQKVTIEAQRDFLTGVFNRKTFEKAFDELVIAQKDQPSELCMLMIDIDHFKQFNDRYGHLIGDEVLKTVARTLTDTLKGRDIVARFGGEEFIVVLPDTPIEGALKVAEMIRSAIASKVLKRKDTGESYGSITVSMGVARYRPESDTLPILIKRADDALYQSKHNGRNQVTKESA